MKRLGKHRTGVIAASVPLGEAPERMAEAQPEVPIWLDADLDLFPEAGRSLDSAAFARLVVEASGCLAVAGVAPGDRVAVVKRNNVDVLILAFAAIRLGAVPALLASRLDRAALPVMLDRLERPLVVTDEWTVREGCLAGLDLAAHARKVVSVGGAVEGAVPFEALRGSPSPPARARASDEPLIVFHTSGTTGVAKLVVHTADSLWAHVRPQLRFGRLLTGRRDKAALCTAFVHARTVAAWMFLMTRGVPIVALSDPAPAAVREMLVRHRPTLLESHPNVLMQWEALAHDPAEPFARVKLFFSTFDSVHPRTIRTLLRASRRRFPLYLQVYGQSEVGGAAMRIHTRAGSRGGHGSRSVGRALPGYTRVRVVDPETGATLPRGTVGVIEIASPGRLKTYVGQDDLAAGNGRGEWWSMGDLGRRTRWGTLHLLDRQVDAIHGVDSGIELEDVLLDRLQALSEVVVIGVPGGPPVPVVCTAGNHPLDASAWARATVGLPALAPPLHCRWDQLPLTATFKVRRPELRRRLLAQELAA